MNVLVTVKHIGIKKILLPALARIKGIKFDVVIHNLDGIVKEDKIDSLNVIRISDKGKLMSVVRPKTENFVQSFARADLDINSYDAFIMAGLCSIPKSLSDYKGKLILYTVAPFYRAKVPEEDLIAGMRNRGEENTIVVHSTPSHYDIYKTRYEYRYIKNTALLAHGLDADAWGNWNGNRKKILTVWAKFDKRHYGKWAHFGDERLEGLPMFKRIVGNTPHQINKLLTEEEMRRDMRDFRIHFLLMKDEQTIGLVESLRTGIPLVSAEGWREDPKLFMKYGHNGFFTNDGEKLRDAVSKLLRDHDYAKRISKNEQETADSEFNFDRYVRNWEEILKGNLQCLNIEQPECYK